MLCLSFAVFVRASFVISSEAFAFILVRLFFPRKVLFRPFNAQLFLQLTDGVCVFLVFPFLFLFFKMPFTFAGDFKVKGFLDGGVLHVDDDDDDDAD